MRIDVKVKVKSSQNKLLKNPDGTYVAYLNASPIKGGANRSLIELLSDEFNIKKSSIRIIKGMTSKNKVVSMGE